MSDPYAGVFFSKDRVETIIEPIEPGHYAQVESVDLPGVMVDVRVLGRGEWMSGCPEKGQLSDVVVRLGGADNQASRVICSSCTRCSKIRSHVLRDAGKLSIERQKISLACTHVA
jgi:hypothetical protein